jgi:hypothetical protein
MTPDGYVGKIKNVELRKKYGDMQLFDRLGGELQGGTRE